MSHDPKILEELLREFERGVSVSENERDRQYYKVEYLEDDIQKTKWVCHKVMVENDCKYDDIKDVPVEYTDLLDQIVKEMKLHTFPDTKSITNDLLESIFRNKGIEFGFMPFIINFSKIILNPNWTVNTTLTISEGEDIDNKPMYVYSLELKEKQYSIITLGRAEE